MRRDGATAGLGKCEGFPRGDEAQISPVTAWRADTVDIWVGMARADPDSGRNF